MSLYRVVKESQIQLIRYKRKTECQTLATIVYVKMFLVRLTSPVLTTECFQEMKSLINASMHLIQN